MTTLAGRTPLMSGGSRGIGLAIATRAAQDGANIVLLAKTAQPHSYLAYTMAKYGMSLVTLGLAEELHDVGIAANSLWPRTVPGGGPLETDLFLDRLESSA